MSRIRTTVSNAVKAILKGELLLHLNMGKYFVHIIYTFFIFGAIIWISLKIEGTMARVEDNKKIISELEILNTEKTFQLERMKRRTNISRMLSEIGSDVTEAEKPATMITK